MYNPGAIPTIPQLDVATSVMRGEFGDPRPPIMLWDFDLNARRAFGLAGRTSYYVQGDFFKRVRPDAAQTIEYVRTSTSTRVLVPYEPEGTHLVGRYRKKFDDEQWSPVLFAWTYPRWLEDDNRDWVLPHAREWDMVYTGSDYDRRRRLWHYYVEQNKRGFRVGVTGVWGNRRGGREEGQWGEKGFRTRLEEETNVELLGPSGMKQLPFEEAMGHLRNARASVQITMDTYAKMGYYTNRWAEIWACGTFGFMDPEIKRMERYYPDWAERHLRVDDPDVVQNALTYFRSGEANDYYWTTVRAMQEFLNLNYGPEAQAGKLLAIAEDAGAKPLAVHL